MRQRRMRLRSSTRSALGAAMALAAGVAFVQVAVSSSSSAISLSPLRRLAANGSATALEDGDCAGLQPWEHRGGLALYVFLLLYVFVALAIVCDDYFVTSLEKISDALGLSQDVAGATFMAAGSSAPELFVSLADNVFAPPKQSLGVGTIVGSAIFNILIIIALSALLSHEVLQLDWRPLLRDSLWYAWSIAALTYTIWDGSVDLYESLALFGSYVAYCLYMSQNERVINACCKRPGDDDDGGDVEQVEAADAQAKALEAAADHAAQLVAQRGGEGKRAWTIDVDAPRRPQATTAGDGGATRMERQASLGSHASHPHPHRLGSQSKLNPMFRSKYRMFQYHPHLHERSASGRTLSDVGIKSSVETTVDPNAAKTLRELTLQPVGVTAPTAAATAKSKAEKNDREPLTRESDDEELGGYFDEIFDVPNGVLPKLWFLFTRPIVIPMRLTIPDCRYPIFSGPLGFTSSFVLSIVWIAVLSHFTVVWATKFGCLAGIPSALMGLTIIAAGTSVPDALSSVLVARDGQGDMAVSNAIGSNVFDILLGLGLPFFLSNIIYKKPVTIVVDDLELSIFILFGVLLSVLLLLGVSRWRLHPIAGGVMAVMYAGYVVFSYLRGLGEI
ncbi:hypothetical protein P43SY_003689 [Pythium insidiosum]|uniref:Sodium/calcium exchanger membrane region domain-containing protein n=1 Tax=Pythium insidiosum TaxID=114742 RepID=A0AAD5LI31_PYTIN|nr:hypothetical protein P43SY_003689 [Pythium insidiosum]